MSGDIAATGYVEVRLGALARNYARVREAAPGAVVGAVVKADAYGLGAARVSGHLYAQGCRDFFVATLEEGIALRQAMSETSPRTPIYIFEGLRTGGAAAYVENTLRPVLNSASQVEEWLGVGAPCAVHLDTGMLRLGMNVEEFMRMFADASLIERLQLQCVMMHFACADEAGHPKNDEQRAIFDRARRCVGDVRISMANSAAAFLGTEFHGGLVRAGIALYGGNPFVDRDNPMEPVASLYARVLQIRQLSQPATVGYGATFEAARGTRIATVGVGYADGYRRSLGNTAHALYAGTRLPVVGRVSMDLTCLDVTVLGPDELRVGDYVEMFGTGVLVDEIAGLCGTISYEVLTGLNARLPRIYVE